MQHNESNLFKCVYLFREIFPYVVIVIGLENFWIITKAVMSTRKLPEVKYRVAEGSLNIIDIFHGKLDFDFIVMNFDIEWFESRISAM